MWKKDNTASGLVNNLIQNFESTLIYKNDELVLSTLSTTFEVTQVLNLGADCFIRYRVAQKRCCHTELYFWLKNILYAIRIGHFRVPKTQTFKMRLGAQPFLWKWVLFAWEWNIKGWAPTLVLKQRPGGTRKWPIRRLVRGICMTVQWWEILKT